jgi:hypothetical protein
LGISTCFSGQLIGKIDRKSERTWKNIIVSLTSMIKIKEGKKRVVKKKHIELAS